MGVPRAMRVRRETSSKACFQPWLGGVESVVEERRSVSRKMKPRRRGRALACVVARRYSSTLCWVPSGLVALCQDRVFRCVAGKRWIWESTIGMGVVGVIALGCVLGVFWFGRCGV